jgi:ribonucleoside-triphosphate reductase
LRLDVSLLEKRRGGLFGASPLTGSIGIVTINLPRLGYLTKNKQDFMLELGKLVDIACDSLAHKRDVIESWTEHGLFPYTSFYLRHIKERFGSYWHNHFSTIGLIGMNEACLNMWGKDMSHSDCQAFAGEVLDFMLAKLLAAQEKTGHFYNLEATPGEGISYSLALKDQRNFPDIISAAGKSGEENPFYTNSTQLPVSFAGDVLGNLDMQDKLQARYTGGTVIHVFLGEAIADPAAVKSFVKKICSNYQLPYFTLTPTFSVCSEHGYLSGEQFICPECGKKTEVYSRVVGYYRPVNQWNNGKQTEFAKRHVMSPEMVA